MKEESFGYDDFLSPFTWRYGSREMRSLFSEREKRATWRKVWLALAEAQSEMGSISKQDLRGIRSKAGRESVDIGKAHQLERKIRHDLMAELRTFAGQAGKGGGKLHLGATSMDIEDNADMMIFRRATDLLVARLISCLRAARTKILTYKGIVCMGWTHLQPAEPTVLGYRFANYAQDLIMDLGLLEAVRDGFLFGKGVKGAVGTSASFKALLGNSAKARRLEDSVMKRLGLKAFAVSTQTYPRKADYVLLASLASIAQSCHKFGLDLRVMQSPPLGEMSEPIGELQVGSSAMPFKRNPVTAERMCSLARIVSVLPSVAFTYAANSILERTLDDSAARRVAIPEAFLAVDECLVIYEQLMRGIRVYPEMIKKNLDRYGPFSGTEALMIRLVERGADRQKVHELIRVASFRAWEAVMNGRDNPLENLLASERAISSRVSRSELRRLLDPSGHTGDARERCEGFVEKSIRPVLSRRGRGTAKAGTEY